MVSIGKKFKISVLENAPLPILGTINAYTALLAESVGAQAIYLSGAGVANASHGLPDLGMIELADVLEDLRRINYSCKLPILVDIDTGFGHELKISRTIRSLEQAGAAAVHLEDQVAMKRCGHRPNKTIVSIQAMGDRIKAAVDARVDPDFVIMARTDAYAAEGLAAAIERIAYYIELGADMIFPEALSTLDEYRQLTQQINVPVLANITEFGETPLFSREQLNEAGVKLILYPLSAFRAMSAAALDVYRTILNEGTQSSVVLRMQTRDELYDILNYRQFEKKIDEYREYEDE
jgi:methylisocitrate lyase